MEITIKRSRRKTITIKIDEKGNINFLCPNKFSLKNINKILEEKRNWIQKTICKIKEKQKTFEPYYNYKKILLLGCTYSLEQTNNVLKVGDNIIKFKGNNIKNALKKWLIKQSNYLCERLDYLANFYNFSYKTVLGIHISIY